MRRPVSQPYTITTEFGVPDSYAKFGYHSGVDYAVPLNRPIYAPISGSLTNVESQTGGKMVVIRDNQGFYHRLMHNNSFSRVNGRVNEGEQVALAGTTGLSTGVHSHWDINRQGVYPDSFAQFINPADWLAGKYQPTQGGDMPIPDQDNYYGRYRKLMNQVRGRDMTRPEFSKNIAGVSDLTAVERISDNPEADAYYALGQWAKANKTKIEQQVRDQQAEITKRDNLIKEIQKKADLSDSLQKKVDELQKQSDEDKEAGDSFLRRVGQFISKYLGKE